MGQKGIQEKSSRGTCDHGKSSTLLQINRIDITKTVSLCSEAIDRKAFPGIAIAISLNNNVIPLCAGCLTYVPWSPEVSSCTVYDLASLTKPLVTAALFMALVSKGLADLNDTLDRFYTKLPADKQGISLKHLLSHSSGLPAHRPYFKELTNFSPDQARNRMERWILDEPLEFMPGASAIYSDTGYILAGFIAEKICGMPLQTAFRHYVTEPAGITGLFWGGEHGLHEREVAPSGFCKYRQRVITGETHDMNAWILGGAAGHAGLFASAPAVAAMLNLLAGIRTGNIRHRYIKKDVVDLFMTPLHNRCNGRWTYGFDTPSPHGSAAGRFFSKGSIGHLGFTGTSFWHDPSRCITIVMLTNRTFPASTALSMQKIKKWRVLLHDAVMQNLTSMQQTHYYHEVCKLPVDLLADKRL